MEYSRVKELIGNFSNQKMLVIGDAVLDHYVHGVVERINPEAPVPVLRATKEYERTGGAGNVAKNTAHLGVETVLISVVGEDENAEKMQKAAGSEGYKAILIKDPTRPTIVKTRHIVDNKMEGQQMLRVDFEEKHDISGDVEDQVIAAIKAEIEKGIGGIIISDYDKGVVTKRVAEEVLDLAGQKDILVAADVKPSRAHYFVGATLVCPNVKEAYEYVGLNHHENNIEKDDLVKMVYTKLCTDVYMTMSADGMHVYCGGEKGNHIPQNHKAIDPSGAGDTVVAVVLIGLLAGANEIEAAILANGAAAVVVNKIGTAVVSPDELSEILVEDKEQIEQQVK